MPCFDPIDVAGRLLDQTITSADPVTGGRNADVWKVRCPSGVFALKRYPQSDGGVRRGTECAALDFMASQGVRNIPRVHAVGADPDVVLLTWLDGTAVEPIEPSHIADCVGFVRELQRLSRSRAAGALPLAKEACLSGIEIVRQIEERMHRFEQTERPDEVVVTLLTDEIRPCLAAAREPAKAWQEDLPIQYRTLSPSDFGCHNAVRGPDGSLDFLDFEYFGWDDPVKLVADFVLHPGMSLSEDLSREFINLVCPIFSDDDAFMDRLRAHLPLYRVRWSLIVLNPLIAPATAKKPSRSERDKIVRECLMKSRRLLNGTVVSLC
jgi:Phosphotransferase enzyme family